MTNDKIVSTMNSYLHTAAEELAKWLKRYLPKTSGDWWEDCVLNSLSYPQRQMAEEKAFTELSQFDLAALLRIANKSWYALRTVVYLPSKERDTIRDMIRVRNNWAHVSADLPGKDAILADLDTLHTFFEERGCGYKLLNDIDQTIKEVKESSFVDFDSFTEQTHKESNNESAVSETYEEIKAGDMVFLKADPDTRGYVITVSEIGGTIKYTVFVDGIQKTFYSGQIGKCDNKPSYNWIDINTFRSYLTAYQINNPSGRDLYSLNSARIDFVPYQFRPALKLIHADEPRILIADSVGVGKTIEAGLIIKELQARGEVENILIICPKPLVAERKWEMEMKRFDEDFVPMDGPMLRQTISDTDRDGEWPVRYSKAIIPYSILDARTYEGEKSGKRHYYGLKDLDPAPHFDLVIVDEAHHIRNGSMEKEKAFEYKCVKYFCDNADAVVMLTATPLQTGDNDLYTLLNVLRPDVVIDKETFDIMARPNAYISEAAKIIRHAEEGWQKRASDTLRGVLQTQWGENVIAANPTYGRILRTLKQDEITRDERVKLISDTESLHSFNSMLNRTRRKDIQNDFCERRSYTLATDFTARQQQLHDELLAFEHDALLKIHGNPRNISFMMSTIKRQAASCIFGLAPYIRNLIDRRFEQFEDDPDFDMDSNTFKDADIWELSSLAKNLLALADNLPEEDPKFDEMFKVIEEKQKLENNKIIIFSTFRYTLSYLRQKLESKGMRVSQVDGSVKDYERQRLRERFELPREDDDALDILLFTEVGSEGLDYQFCDMMINYDLPWNPMRIEQRIGRIDRCGQKSETVSIYNMITNGTVDADIYNRCLVRIGIFEDSIGECDEILGEIATQIDQIVMDTSLTESERNEKLEQLADNEVRKVQEMNQLEEEQKDLFGFDLSEYMTSQEIRNAENPWISANNIQILIEQYLSKRLGQGNYIVGEGEIKQIRLSADARSILREDFKKLSLVQNAASRSWDGFLKGNTPWHTITFNSEAAEEDRDAFFITTMHPLAKQAAAYFEYNKQAYIRLCYATEDIPEGTYYFSVYAWSYTGINPHTRLVVICEDDTITAELPDILQETQSIETSVEDIDPSEWDDLENKHIIMWEKARDSEIEEADNTATFRKESLSNNFYNQKRSLEQRILDTGSESLQRMYKSQLETATRKYEDKINEINKNVDQTDIHTNLIANGILNVVH